MLEQDFFYHALPMYVLLIYGAGCFLSGVLQLLSWRPLFFWGRWSFLGVLMPCVGIGLRPALWLFESVAWSTYETPVDIWLHVFLVLVVGVCLLLLVLWVIASWFATKGIICVGVSDKAFVNAVHYALQKRRIAYKWGPSMYEVALYDWTIHLARKGRHLFEMESVGAQLRVFIKPGTTRGILQLRGDNTHVNYDDITAGVNEYYTMHGIGINRSRGFVGFSVGLLIMTASFLLLYGMRFPLPIDLT